MVSEGDLQKVVIRMKYINEIIWVKEDPTRLRSLAPIHGGALLGFLGRRHALGIVWSLDHGRALPYTEDASLRMILC